MRSRQWGRLQARGARTRIGTTTLPARRISAIFPCVSSRASIYNGDGFRHVQPVLLSPYTCIYDR